MRFKKGEVTLKKIQFSFGDATFEALKESKKMTEKSSLAEVVRDSVIYYYNLLKNIQDGYKVHLMKENEDILFMPNTPPPSERKT